MGVVENVTESGLHELGPLPTPETSAATFVQLAFGIGMLGLPFSTLGRLTFIDLVVRK